MDIEFLMGLLAVILSALAFLVAFLQVVLEYTTSSPWRNMCSQAAIGPSAKQRKLGFTFRRWKVKVYYPLLRLDFRDLKQAFLLTDAAYIGKHHPFRAISRRHAWSWRPIQSNEKITWRAIA